MQKVSNKAIAKVAAVATGLAMATSMLSLAPMAHAASLTDAQVQSILSLLSSFGANSSTIANVKAALTGQPTTTTSGSGSTTTSASCNFTMDLHDGVSGAEVTCLQKALIAAGYNIPAITNGTANYGYYGSQTTAAVKAWQASQGITPDSGYFGPISRSHWNLGGGSSTSTGGSTGSTGSGTGSTSGTGLQVSLSANSPSNTVLVAGQGIGKLADFTFTNPTNSPINVTGLTFNRTGVSNDQTISNVYLYNAGTPITDSAGLSNGQFSYSNSAGLFTVPAGGTYTVSVRADIATGTQGQQLGVSLVSVSSNGTLDSSVSFPIMGGYQTISSANLATVDFNSNVTPSATTISAQNDYPVWQDNVSVGTNPVKLESMTFTNLGSIDSQYLTNLRLYVDGVQVGQAVPSMGSSRSVTFDLSSNPVTLSTQSHMIKVLANVTGGAGRTIQFSIQRSSDAMFVDSQLNQPVLPTYNSNTFSPVNAGVVTMNAVTSSSGVSVSKDPATPTDNVAFGASNVEWASYSMLASGEPVKVRDLYVYSTDSGNTATGGSTAGLKNGKIMVNGVQVGSTKDIGGSSSTATDFALGSSLILPAGQTTNVQVYADAKGTNSVNLSNNTNVTVTLKAGSSNGQGQYSLVSTDVPSSDVTSNGRTVTNSSLVATKYTGYGNQSFVAGANNVKLGAFTLSTGSTEGVSVNNIALNLTGSSNVTNLTLKDDATGNVLGSVVTTPSSSNSFAVNLDIPASSSKTIDVYGNILSTASGNIQATVTTNTSGTGDQTGTNASVGSNVSLQNMTVGSGSLTVTQGAGDPVSNNVLAGASQVHVGQFEFSAQNSPYTVQNLAVLVPNGVATSVTNVTLSYKDKNGATQTVTQPLQVNASDKNATASFTGLSMYVPENNSSNLDVYVGTPTISSGATSGAGIRVSLANGTTTTDTFRAVNAAGSQLTYFGSSPVQAGGTFYVRKSIPTLAMVSTNSTVPATGQPLYKFSISADPAGAIEWSKLSFNIATSNVTLSNMFLTDDATGNSLTGSDYGTINAAGTKVTFNLPTINTNNGQAQYQQVAAGATKTYDLYGTVTGWGAGNSGSTLTISLASDGSATTTTAAANLTGANTVWSDRSANNHSLSTSDWTNGYLLKNFTSSAVSYSK